MSSRFSLSNGVKQGAVLSTIIYCLYSNGLFELLRSRRNGWLFNQYPELALSPLQGSPLHPPYTIKNKPTCMVFLKTMKQIEPMRLNSRIPQKLSTWTISSEIFLQQSNMISQVHHEHPYSLLHCTAYTA